MRTVRFPHGVDDSFRGLLFVLQPYYVKSTHSLLMTSSASRSQAANMDDVLAKVCVSLISLRISWVQTCNVVTCLGSRLGSEFDPKISDSEATGTCSKLPKGG